MRQVFVFEDPDGNRIGRWETRDIDEAIENHSPGNLVFIAGELWEIIGARSNGVSRDGKRTQEGDERFSLIRILWKPANWSTLQYDSQS